MMMENIDSGYTKERVDETLWIEHTRFLLLNQKYISYMLLMFHIIAKGYISASYIGVVKFLTVKKAGLQKFS
jgi:hypothetical protein